MTTSVFDVLRNDIQEGIDSLNNFMRRGGSKDYPQYCEAVGKNQALEGILARVNELEQAYIEGDVDE